MTQQQTRGRRANPRLPRPVERRVERLVEPLQRFITTQTVTSTIMLLAALVALGLANSGLRESYEAALHTEIGVRAGDRSFDMSLEHWINDGLMALFFFLLGLEIKRELLAGSLHEPERARLLILTALGGMLVPAGLFALIAPPHALPGWGIPMATDAAFAVGVLALLGGRVPAGLAAFLIGLAIVDDIGAVVVIAIFYTQGIDLVALGAAAGLVAVMATCNVLGFRRPLPYLLVGIALWYATLCSGVHSTIAGVLAAASVPARVRVLPRAFERRARNLVNRLHSRRRRQLDILGDPSQHEIVAALQREAIAASTPLQRWEHSLENPIALIVLPVFALANAGVAFASDGGPIWSDRTPVAIAVGLVVGKCVGITGACWLGRRFGLGSLPDDVSMRQILGMSLVAGMGFTMSIFVANLAYPDAPTALQGAKAAVLASSLVAGILGYATLRMVSGPATPSPGASRSG